MEKIVEVPVENKVYVDKPYEKIVEVPYEVVREDVQFRERILDVDEKDVGRYPDAQVLTTEVDYVH